MRPALELIGASFGYPGRMVLENISFSVSVREVFAIVGPNRVGETTLIQAASGILPLCSGEILVEGHEITHMKPDRRARRIAVVLQATRVPPAFTARQVVAMGRRPYYSWLNREGPDDIGDAEAHPNPTPGRTIDGRTVGRRTATSYRGAGAGGSCDVAR